MGSDKYKVEILHYLNPHLIWALVEKEGEDNNPHFEQLGLYGVSPLDLTIDVDGNLETNRCEQWSPVVLLAIKKIFLKASEIWFSVTFSDKTTTIFDDNVHKYGDFTIKMINGKTVSLLEELLDTGFVAEDIASFHQNLKTKLDYNNTVSVVNKIRQSLQLLKKSENLNAVLKMQISVLQTPVELEETAILSNVGIASSKSHSQLLLHKKLNDLNTCNDVDEESAGRACTRSSVSNLNSGLLKKLNLIETQSVHIAPTLMKNNDSVDIARTSEYDQYDEGSYGNSKNPHVRKRNNKKEKKDKGKAAENNKKFIAFGPPGINPTQYRLRELEMDVKLPSTKNITHEEADNRPDSYIQKKADSDDGIEHSHWDTSEQEDIPDKFQNNVINQNNVEKDKIEDAKKNVKNAKHAPTSVERKMNFLKEKIAKMNTSSSSADTDSTVRQGDDSDSESISVLVAKLDLSRGSIKKEAKPEPEAIFAEARNNVNPFKNLDGSKSVFVDKLISPTLMVHTKKGNCILPVSNLRDIPFGSSIHVVLSNMSVKKPMRVQTVSWPTILRGHSLFLVSPAGSGKTLGYLPAVCRLVNDSRNTANGYSVARLTCIIVCATAKSVSYVEEMCNIFLHEAHIFACYTGMTDVTISTTILNGCDILISTPTILARLMRENLGLDLRSLNMFIIDDCERISEVYQNELKFCLSNVKVMLKNRANKELKVQYVVTSRIWSHFMSSLAKKAPDSVVCIGAFQECVLYSECDTSFQFLEKEKKIDAVLNFIESIDQSKKTVIACRSDDEVQLVERALVSLKYVVYACDSTMNVHDLYSIDLALSEYEEPLKGPILVCCDSNLNHLNITDAHYLIHFSLPELFSTFCKRFAVLIDNYSSVFNDHNTGVKIKIFLETSNVEQLPKILNFIKRCSANIPDALDKISLGVMLEKDLEKAKAFVPLCSTLLKLGKCADVGYCKERHAIFEEYDKPAAWMPREGTITFTILHHHSPVHYSARMMTCITNSGVTKYPQTYSSLSIKLGMYYSKEVNKKLHGVAKPGDLCAVSLKQNFFARCQVIKVLNYTQNNLPSLMLINLIDEEKYETARDTCLYHLPDELKNINSHVVKVILANIAPQDKDVTFSKLAEDHIKKITDNNDEIYMRAQISLVIGNCILVESLEACQDLSSLNETVVKNNFKDELLDGHAVNNPNHISDLLKLGEHLEFVRKNEYNEKVDLPKQIKVLPTARWAHLESEEHTVVYYLHAKSPSLFFLQNIKFQNCLKNLLSDVKKHVLENPEPVDDIKEGDVVLAEFPDDASYERARVDRLLDNGKVECFFVDLGDWSIVNANKVLPISEKLITQLPFQAIECRLVGIRPAGDNWSEFSTNWFVDQFYDSDTNQKYLYAKRFTKEKADVTDGFKYGVGLIDTYKDDVYINKLLIDVNLAEENEEIEYLNTNTIKKTPKDLLDEENFTKEADLKTNINVSEETTDNKTTVLNPPHKSKARSMPSHLLSYAKKSKISSPSSTLSSNSLVEANSVTPIRDNELAKETLDNTKTNNLYEADSELGNNKQLAVVSPSESPSYNKEVTSSESSSTFEDSEESVRTNQPGIMNLFRRMPIRSMPLVNDDIDDDQWDSSNPIQMLMAPQKDTSNVTEAKKAISPAICNLIPEVNVKTDSKYEIINHVSTKNIKEKASKLKTNADLEPTVTSNNAVNTRLWSVKESNKILSLYDDTSADKIVIEWCQDNNNVIMKVKVKVEKYEVIIDDKKIRFLGKVNDTDYGFEFELYGVVNVEKSTHTIKDSHVEIHFNKLMAKNWLTLYKGKIKIVMNDCKKVNKNIAVDNRKSEENLRKPKIVWRQNKSKVIMKVILITEKYELTIQDKHIKFYSQANDEEYGFDFELYGVVDVNKSCHSNKGQYIQVNLHKAMGHNWLVLGKGYIKKWIVYDVDSIDVSSDDEQESTDEINNIRNILNINRNSDSEDDFDDDVNFEYKKQY